LCEQTGEEPNIDKVPPEFEDFPWDVQQGILIFAKLGDKIVADVGYMGKDYTLLPILMKQSGVMNEEICTETILRLDERVKIKSAEEMKRERDKLKNK
jgi:hypothetical protein